MRTVVLARCLAGCTIVAAAGSALGQPGGRLADLSAEEYRARTAQMSRQAEARGLAEPFKGITADGTLEAGLYPLESTGVSTQPLVAAAQSFIATLSADQQARTLFPVDDDEWRKWMNPHFYDRAGVSFGELDPGQTEAALALLRASLSARGVELTRDIMRLNTTLGELNGNDFIQYGEDQYHLTLMGTPSLTEPWGWQLEGHHLALNYFVRGDQVVLAPAFWGSEPAVANSGAYAGTEILGVEQALGLELMRGLTATQAAQARIAPEKTGNNIVAQAFADNVIVDYAGLPVSTMTAAQQRQVLGLIRAWLYNLREPHAEVQMRQVEAALDATWFAWVGDTADDSVFYYRIQSPVLLIEFDHQTPVGLGHLYPRGVPYKEHIHAVVRLPNGNDYGKELLRQHHLLAAH